jgi:hypothetical protein
MFVRRNVLWIASLLVALGCSGERTDELGHANDDNSVLGGDAAVEPGPDAGLPATIVGNDPPGKKPSVDAGQGPDAGDDTEQDGSVSIPEFTLMVARSGGNGSGKVVGTSLDATVIDCTGGTDDCSETALAGTEVVLTAEAASDSTFSWGGACASETSAQCTVTLDQSQNVTIAFQLRLYTLTLAVSADDAFPGTGTISSIPSGIRCSNASDGPTECTFQFEAHTPIQLEAVPTPGPTDPNRFEQWGGGTCSGTATTCSFTIEADTVVDAVFNYIIG